VQDEVLGANPDADIQVYALWFNMLPGDARGEWDPRLLTDERVTHFWDEEKLAGRFFAETEKFFSPIAWDAYYLYGPEARWDDRPAPLVSWGYTIMGKRNQLQEDFSDLLDS
jgi:hypothetical protein